MNTKRVKTVRRNGLQWQVKGIIGIYKEANQYVKKQNKQKVNGFNDWRLPTLFESFELVNNQKSLTKTQIQFGNIYVWTSSKFNASRAWVVDFGSGGCYRGDVDYINFVRAVRFIKSKDK